MNQALFSRVNQGLWAALLAVTLAGYLLIPAGSQLPIHWGPSGEPDTLWPRDAALLMPVVIGLAVSLIFWALARVAPPAQVAASRHAWQTVVPALTGLFLTIQVGVVVIGLGYPDMMVRMICAAIGIMLVLLGNIMPKMQRNGLAGIRLPWLGDAIVWQKTQRLGGFLFVGGGVILFVCALFVAPPIGLFGVLLAALLIPMVVTTIYSYQRSHRR